MRSPGWLLTAAAILALGIGGSVAVYSTVEAVLLRPPAFAAPNDLAVLWETDTRRGHKEAEVSWGRFEELRKQNSTLAGVATVSSVNLDFALLDGGDPLQVEGVSVTPNYFDILGVRPVLGRALVASDAAGGDEFHIVISHRLWTQRFGAQPDVLTRPVQVSGAACRIVGVMPPEFAFPRGVDLWAPQTPLNNAPGLRVFKLVARRKTGVAWQQVEADLNVVIRRLDETLPASARGFTSHIVPMDKAVFGNARPALWTLFAAALLLLVTACANVANLFLSRLAGRRRELAVRMSLGASRGRIIGMLLAESLLISLLAGVIGVTLAMWAVSIVARFGPQDVPGLSTATVSWPAIAFACLLVLASTLLAGLAPAWHAAPSEPWAALKDKGSLRAKRLRDMLIVSEVAVSLLLLIGCGLLGSSLLQLSRIDPGFRKDNILTFRVTLTGQPASTQDGRKKFYRELLDKLRAMPGVESAAAVLIRPLSGSVGWDTPFTMEGQTPEEQSLNPYANYEAISPGYFATMGIPVLQGRDFSQSDREGVVIINDATARRYFGTVDAVGKRLKLGTATQQIPWLTVAGVVKDTHYREWEAARADLYIPFEQRSQHRSDFVVRTTVAPETLSEAVRRAVVSQKADQPISSVTTVEKLVDDALARPRFLALLFGLFGITAAILTVAGLFAVLSFVFLSQQKEMAIRMAVGATPAHLRQVVISYGIVRTAFGAALGIAAAAFAVRLLDQLLYGVTVYDGFVWLGALSVLFLVTSLATLAPAWRASRVDPQRLLQAE